MARFVFLFSLVAFFIGQSTAHFLLNYPTTIGFDDDLEGTAPCGSFSVDFSTDTVTNWHVGGDSIAVTNIHPVATWLFRATLDITASGNWTNFLPAVVQVGLGNYCEQGLITPASWVGSKGVIGIVQDAPDGILYQCAAVIFVAGVAAPPSVCQNVTGLTASYTSDGILSSLGPSATGISSAGSTMAMTMSGSSAMTMTGTGAMTMSASSATTIPTTSAKPSAAAAIHPYGGWGSLVWVFTVAVAVVMTCLL